MLIQADFKGKNALYVPDPAAITRADVSRTDLTTSVKNLLLMHPELILASPQFLLRGLTYGLAVKDAGMKPGCAVETGIDAMMPYDLCVGVIDRVRRYLCRFDPGLEVKHPEEVAEWRRLHPTTSVGSPVGTDPERIAYFISKAARDCGRANHIRGTSHDPAVATPPYVEVAELGTGTAVDIDALRKQYAPVP